MWFNGYRHLPGHAPRPRGFRDGEGLVDILTGGEGGRVLPWNEAFGGAAAMREDGEGFTLPEVQFNWGLRLTLLSPTPERASERWGATGRNTSTRCTAPSTVRRRRSRGCRAPAAKTSRRWR